jgi:hypothetical protein
VPNFGVVLRSLKDQPGYTLMRSLGRFPSARSAVAGSRRALQGRRTADFLRQCEARMSDTMFPGLDREAFVRDLETKGVAFGLMLSPDAVQAILDYADTHPCYADRLPQNGFMAKDHREAERKLGKAILVAQYFDTIKDCPTIAKLAKDPALQWIAGRYINSLPTFVGSNLWWSFAADASEEDRNKHAHLFHRDVDDFRFFKYFFYITTVDKDGAHICVVGSHHRPPVLRRGDQWNIRRYSDEEIAKFYPS